MDAHHKQLLKKHRVELVNNIKDVDSVLDHLVSEGVIEEDEEKEIKDREGGKAQVRKLLATLAEKQGNSFHSFCTALENSRHKRLADLLRGHGAKTGERVFIIHAGEDKAGFVEPLVQALQDGGLSQQDIFYDVLSIGVGDVIRSRIMAAMASESLELVVTVLSKNSLNHKYWPKLELETALRHNKQLFPVWLDDNEDDFQEFNGLVGKYCPTLKSIRGYKVPLSSTEEQVRKVANEIVSKLSTRKAPDTRPKPAEKGKKENNIASRSTVRPDMSDSSEQSSSIDEKKRKRENQERSPEESQKRSRPAESDSEDCEDDSVMDTSGDEDNAYFTMLKMSRDVFHPGNVTDPNKFEQAVQLFQKHAELVIGTETSGSEAEVPLERKVKLRLKRAAKQHVKEVNEMAFTTAALRDLQTYNRIFNCFEKFEATLKTIKRGCVLCCLDFDDMSCYQTFLAAYRDGRLSETLTRELITDDMRAAEGEDLYVHVTLLGADGECQDDSLSDEEEPRDCTGTSQVASTSDLTNVMIKQEPLSPVKPEPTQDLPSCSLSFEEMDTSGIKVKAESELHRQFAAIADHLGSMWEWLASSLGFNTDYIRDLTARLPPSLRPHQLICDWMEKNAGDVTLEQLVQALRNAGIHDVADAADSGQLFLTEADSEALKGKADEDVDNTYRADGRLPLKREFPDSSSSDSDSSSDEEEQQQDPTVSHGQSTTTSPSKYPTGEDAFGWNNCLQSFFKTDGDMASVIQQTWPSNLLVKHLIRDKFFHSYLCEYWKQYKSFPGTISAFVIFVTEMSAKLFASHIGMNHEQLNAIFKSHCLILGKAAFESHANNQSMYVYKGQFEWDDIRQSSFGWLQPAVSYQSQSAFQFVHDSIRQFLMAVWVAHTVRTQTDSTKLLRVCAEKSAHLPITRYSLSHILTDSHLVRFATLLLQQEKELDDFNHLLPIVTIIAESKRLEALSTLTQKLFPDKTLDLSALPEISHHGLQSLTRMIKSKFIQTIRLPENISIQDVLKQYPFRPTPVSNVDHASQVKYLSYLPLFDCMSNLPSTSRGKCSLQECRFAKADNRIDADTIHGYLQFAPSLQNITVRSVSFLEGTPGNLSNSLLFTPNVTNVTIAVRNVSSEDVAKAMNILSCLHKLKNVELTEYGYLEECFLSVRFPTFTVKCNPAGRVCPEVLSFRPFDVKELALEGRPSETTSPSFTTPTRRTKGIYALGLKRLVPYFRSLKSLVELKFDSLHNTSTSTWSMLFQGLASLPAKSTEAGKFPPLEILCCTNCELTSQNVKAFVRHLQTLQNLREIDLSHNAISDEAVTDLAKGLGSCQKLRKVNLSSNKLSDRGCFLPPLPNLEEINLSNNAICDEAIPGLCQGFGSCQNLTKVNLSSNMLSDRGDFLPPLPNLEEINLSDNAISDEAVPGLVQSFGSCQKLKEVNLSGNKLSDRLDFLTPLPNLVEIDLSHNAISDEAVPGLAKGLGSCQNLNYVHLEYNKISNKGALLLLLQDQCKQMQVETAENYVSDDLLSLLSNSQYARQVTKLFIVPEGDTSEDAAPLNIIAVHLLLQFLPQLPNLQELALCLSCDWKEGAELRERLYGVQPPLKTLKLTLRDWSLSVDKITRLLTRMLQQFPLLEDIDLSCCDISDGKVPGLAEGLGSCQNMKKLNLSHNKLSYRGDFLPPLLNLKEIDLSHNAISDKAVPGLAHGLGSCPNLRTVNFFNNNISNKGALILLLELPRQLRVEVGSNIRISPDLQSLLTRRTDARQVGKLELTSRTLSREYFHPLRITAVPLLLQFLPQLTNLQELAFCVSCQGKEEAEHIKQLYGVNHPLKILTLTLRESSSDTMTRLLTLMLQMFSQLEAIDLSGSGICDEAVPALLRGLGYCQNLRKVNLSDNKLLDRGRVLPPLPNLEEIDLSNNVISDEAVSGLAEVLALCPNLRIVNLSSNNSISNKGALMLLLEQSQQLQVKSDKNYSISPDLRSLLSRRTGISQVTKLDLTSGESSQTDVSLRVSAVHLLLQFLPQLHNLQELALCVSCQGEEEAEHINQLHGVRHVLKKLKLKYWSSDMIRLSTQMFQSLPLLEDIDLSHNKISDKAVPGVTRGLGSCQNLKKVNLSHNMLSDRGDFLPPLPNLEEIDLSHNAISDEAAPGLAKSLRSCKNLEKVNLRYNKLSDVSGVIEEFIDLRFLTRVDIGRNSISDESLPTIAAWLKIRTAVETIGLFGNRFSAEGVRYFVRTMKARAYFGDTLLYDGSQADVDGTVESGGEDVRREEQQWERLRKGTRLIKVKARQQTVMINHTGPRSNNAQ